MQTDPETKLPEGGPLTRPLNAMRPLVGPESILVFQQFFRCAERAEKERNPKTADLQKLCDEMLVTMISTGAIEQTDMSTNPLVVMGMANMFLIMSKAMGWGETVNPHEPDLLKGAFSLIVEATVKVAIGSAQMRSLVKEKEGAIIQ